MNGLQDIKVFDNGESKFINWVIREKIGRIHIAPGVLEKLRLKKDKPNARKKKNRPGHVRD